MVSLEEKMLAFFRYDPFTGQIILRNPSNSPGRRSGDQCRSSPQGYLRVSFERRFYAAHRVGWLLQTGSWPDGPLDHINLNRSDNRWSNLRRAEPWQNNANWRPMRDGRKGVTVHRTGRYQAQVKCHGVNHYLGLFDTEEAAAAAYAAKATELFGEFARVA